jgi:hypothetical protein
MHWIKNISAKRWNFIHGSKDHLWGNRFFARAIKDKAEYDYVMNYIDQNAVVVGLAAAPEEWKASGAFYKQRDISGLVDLSPNASQQDTKLLPLIPCIVSKLIPPSQLEHIKHHIGAYAVSLDKLFDTIPKIGEHRNKYADSPIAVSTYLHYTLTPTIIISVNITAMIPCPVQSAHKFTPPPNNNSNSRSPHC